MWFKKEKLPSITHHLEVPLMLEDGTSILLDNPKPRREVNMDLFRKVKRALRLKKAKKYYKTEEQVADRFKISTTTVSLIKRSASLKQYFINRRAMSKPEKYKDD